MSEIDNGGPAFPFAATDPSNVPMQAQGMTLRDWFAGQALAGILANPSIAPNADDSDQRYTPAMAAEDAYDTADAMLRARKGGAA